MSTKHIRTTADLVRFGAGLRIDCTGCGASRTVNGFEAGQLAGVRPLGELQLKLKCRRCGARRPTLAILPPV